MRARRFQPICDFRCPINAYQDLSYVFVGCGASVPHILERPYTTRG